MVAKLGRQAALRAEVARVAAMADSGDVGGGEGCSCEKRGEGGGRRGEGGEGDVDRMDGRG